MITYAVAHECLYYKDGRLYWKTTRTSNAPANTEASPNSTATSGYKVFSLNRKKLFTHRVIFLMHHGYMPKFVDHIDGNRMNNKIENLREASHAENMRNSKMRINNSSGVKGVAWHARSKKWIARISVNCKIHHLGSHMNIEDAAKVIRKFREQLHGEFANHGDAIAAGQKFIKENGK